MITIAASENYDDDLGNPMTMIVGDIDGYNFKYQTDGILNIQQALDFVTANFDAVNIQAQESAERHTKIQIAPDFVVCSPKIKSNKEEAYQEAKDEALKPAKSIAKLALTLPRLIEHLESLDARIVALEKIK